MQEDKIIELKKILDEGTPHGEVLAIWSDGTNTVHVLTEEINLLAFNFITRKVGKLFNMNSERQGGLNIPLKFKENLHTEGDGHYYVEKSSSRRSKKSS